MTLDSLRSHANLGADGYSKFDGRYRQMAVTLEDAEFLYALVRLTKPGRVLELGTGYGISARFIAEALAENGNDGRLFTIEPDPAIREAARKALLRLPVFIGGHYQADDLDWDIVFVDSGYQTREHDIRTWLTNGYRGLIVVHDANRDYDLSGGVGVFLPGLEGMWLGRAA